MKTLRQQVFDILEIRNTGTIWGRVLSGALLCLVALNVVAAIAYTDQRTAARYGWLFDAFEVFSVAVFTVEYALRLWSCVGDPAYKNPLRGRIRYALTPLALVDLAAILPFYLPMIVGLDLRFVRVLRLLRVFRLFKASRYFKAFGTLGAVLRAKREELVVTLSAVVAVLILASSVMYLAERGAQPEVFSSIPAAMWWAVVTLTTVGYGDIYPVTALGKCCAGVIALFSVGLFALPAGILASGLTECIRADRGSEGVCPYCGRSAEGVER